MAQWTRDDYRISDDPALLDVGMVWRSLGRTYWAAGRTREIMEQAIAGSLCFGLYRAREQVGFARVITDRATFAYVADVFVAEAHRGGGLGRWLVQTVLAHPELTSVSRWMLATRDAHQFYRGLGFDSLSEAAIFMERRLESLESDGGDRCV